MTLRGGTIVADVSIIHPAAQTYVDAAAARRDAAKVTKYRRSLLVGACEFVPLSVETHGRMGEPATELPRKVAGLAADTGRAG